MFSLKKNNPRLIVCLIFVIYFLTSCGNDKLAKCKEIRLIAIEIDQKTKENLHNTNAQSILDVVDVFQNNSTKMNNIKIKDEQLNKYKQELSNIYQQYADVTRNFIQAFQNKDVDQALFYKKEITKLFQQQQQLVTNIDTYCQRFNY